MISLSLSMSKSLNRQVRRLQLKRVLGIREVRDQLLGKYSNIQESHFVCLVQ